MSRSASLFIILTAMFSSAPVRSQDAAALQSYFTGKQVVLKIDMPGSQKGVDLRFYKPSAMDWREYSGRVKQFGVAIRQGDVSHITAIVLKREMMEFQLDGGVSAPPETIATPPSPPRPSIKAIMKKISRDRSPIPTTRTERLLSSATSTGGVPAANARIPSTSIRPKSPAAWRVARASISAGLARSPLISSRKWSYNSLPSMSISMPRHPPIPALLLQTIELQSRRPLLSITPTPLRPPS